MKKYAITFKYNESDDDHLHITIIKAENATEAVALIEKKYDHKIEWITLNNEDDPYHKINPPKKENINEKWQLCPKCKGDGNLSRFNSQNIANSEIICDVCYGRKIININTGLPPIYKTKE